MKSSFLALSLPAAAMAATNATARSLLFGDLMIPCDVEVTYTIHVKDTWCRDTHPFDFEAGIDGPFPPGTGAHTSPTFAISHQSSYSLGSEGSIASAGMCEMATTGSTATLNSEWDTVAFPFDRVQGDALPSCGSETAVNDPTLAEQTLSLSFVSPYTVASFGHMLAPSPDFFTGGSADLCQDGYWTLYEEFHTDPYDAGCDSGDTFITDDVVTDPQEGISTFELQANRLFQDSMGDVQPVATFTITLNVD